MLYLYYQKICLECGWYVPKSSNLHYPKLSWTCLPKSLLWIFSQIKIKTPSPCVFLPSLHDFEKPLTKNCTVGNVLSSLILVKMRISVYYITISFNCSNLFGKEFMLRFPIMILFGFLILIFLIFNNRFGEVSLMDL